MVSYELTRDILVEEETPEEFGYVGPVPAAVPGAGADGAPAAVVQMNRANLGKIDYFTDGYGMRTDDLGDTWSSPGPYDGLSPRHVDHPEFGSVQRAAYDLWPAWHDGSETVLATGNTIYYDDEGWITTSRERTVPVTTYDPGDDEWSEWTAIVDETDLTVDSIGAGYGQWAERPDGTVLLPVAIKRSDWDQAKVTVLECSFDGSTLTAESYGEVIESLEDETRGLAEPSITRYDGEYYLTIRSNERGYVTKSDDGLQYEPLREWRFDSDLFLGNYNTQQHWVTHSNGLFLVYTRLDAGSDRVFRHRAPLLMAEVDPKTLRVDRDTERVLIPDRGARIGCFGTAAITPEETWVTAGEFLQHGGRPWLRAYHEAIDADGSVHLARIEWDEPNVLAPTTESN